MAIAEDIVVQIRTENKGNGTKAAAKDMQTFATATETSQKLMKRLFDAGAMVAITMKGLQQAARFFGSAIMESVKANEILNAKITAAGDQWGKFKSYVGDTLVSFIESTGVLDNMGEIATALANVFKGIGNTIKVLGNLILAYIFTPLTQVLKVASYFSDDMESAYNVVKDMRDGFKDNAIEAAKSYEWNSKILDTQKNNAKTIKEIEAATKSKSDAEKKATEEIQKQTAALAEYEQKLKSESQNRTIEFTANIARSANEGDIEAYVNTDAELNKAKELNDLLLEAKIEGLDAESQAYQEALIERAIMDEEYNAQRTALEEAYNLKNNDFLKAYAKTQTAAYKQRGEALSEFSKLATSENKKLALIGKTTATAEAIINTYQGATKALAQGGFWGMAMAAAVIANGLASVAQIQGVALAKGGVVQATEGGVPAIIGEGGSDEAVIPLDNARAMRRIGSAINDAGGAGSSNITTININASGGLQPFLDEITDAVREGLPEAVRASTIIYRRGAGNSGVAV
jgi:hypothetical protein